MSMSRKKCCVPGCIESGSHQTLHLFPNPAKYKDRFNLWVYAIGGNILGLDNEDIYKHRSVCHAHFEEKYCCRYNKLSNIAVPTLKLPGSLSLPKFTFGESRPMREIQNYSVPLPQDTTSSVTPSTSALSIRQSTSMFTPDVQKHLPTITIVGNNELQKDCVQELEGKNISAPHSTKSVKEQIRVTPEEKRLHKKLIEARVKLRKYRNIVKKQSAKIKAAKNIAINPALLATLEKLPSTARIFTLMQFREVKKKNKRRRFSLQEKILALSIFKQAPKEYKFLRNIFILPAPQTLSKLVSQAFIKPGKNMNILSQLKYVADKMKLEERLCILLFFKNYFGKNVIASERT